MLRWRSRDVKGPGTQTEGAESGWPRGRDGRAACASGVSAVRCPFLDGKRAWKGHPSGADPISERLCHVAGVEIREFLGRGEARRLAEPEPVQEIAQPGPPG